jgi:hypothetical protein
MNNSQENMFPNFGNMFGGGFPFGMGNMQRSNQPENIVKELNVTLEQIYKEETNSMEMYHSFSLLESINKYYIVKGDRIILTFYNGYREEQSKTQKFKHYSQLWDDRKIYM